MAVYDRDVTVMQEKAQSLAMHQASLQQHMEDVRTTAQGLTGSFEGEAAEAFQNAVSQDLAQMERLHETMGTFLAALNEDIERTVALQNAVLNRFTNR